jgi:folate-binding protein YgfZ
MTQATLLTHRGILKISGKDRAAFLQGLITNDVNKISEEQAIYAALLSPQGKFQYDLFLSACKDSHGQEVWMMECDRDRADALQKRLSLYKLRAEVTVENISNDYSVYAIYGSNDLNKLAISSKLGAAKPMEGVVVFVDPRLLELGIRVHVPLDKAENFLKTLDIDLLPFEEYDRHRLKLGIPDGPRDVLIDKGILLESGFDELNAIDWQKGCYMGQELTARTRYRGLIRKRLIPVKIQFGQTQGEMPTCQSPVFQEGVEVGEMRSVVKEWGIAMIRLEALRKSLPFSCGDATVTPHIPPWMCLPSSTDEE